MSKCCMTTLNEMTPKKDEWNEYSSSWMPVGARWASLKPTSLCSPPAAASRTTSPRASSRSSIPQTVPHLTAPIWIRTSTPTRPPPMNRRTTTDTGKQKFAAAASAERCSRARGAACSRPPCDRRPASWASAHRSQASQLSSSELSRWIRMKINCSFAGKWCTQTKAEKK